MNIKCCDRCGRNVDVVTINIPVAIDFTTISQGIIDRSFSKDLCSDCCSDLSASLTAFMAAGQAQLQQIQSAINTTLSKFGPISVEVERPQPVQAGPVIP